MKDFYLFELCSFCNSKLRRFDDQAYNCYNCGVHVDYHYDDPAYCLLRRPNENALIAHVRGFMGDSSYSKALKNICIDNLVSELRFHKLEKEYPILIDYVRTYLEGINGFTKV